MKQLYLVIMFSSLHLKRGVHQNRSEAAWLLMYSNPRLDSSYAVWAVSLCCTSQSILPTEFRNVCPKR